MLRRRFRRIASSVCFMLLVQMLFINGTVPEVLCRDADGLRVERADVLGRCDCHSHADELVITTPIPPSSGLEIAEAFAGLSARGCHDRAIDQQMRVGQKRHDPRKAMSANPGLVFLSKVPLPQALCTAWHKIDESPPPSQCRSLALLSVWRC